MILVHDFLRSSARRYPDKAAVICDDVAHSFAQVDHRSDQLACALQRAGVCRGDRIATLLDNSAELVVSVFGILKAGGVFVIINPTTKTGKLSSILNDCGAAGLIAQPNLARVAGPAVAAAKKTVKSVFWTDAPPEGTDRQQSFGEIFCTSGPAIPADPELIDEDLCAIIYTSGSTGQPKGVMLTHHNMTNTAWSISTYLENTPDDMVLSVLPLSFSYGLFQVVVGACVGHTVVLERSFAYPYKVLQRMHSHRVTGLPGVPTIFATLLNMSPFDGLDLSALRYLTNAGAAIAPAHLRRLAELLPQARIFPMYGQTECTRVCFLDPARVADKPASVGRPIPNTEAYVVDEFGRRVEAGVEGELVVRGANVMRGYWGKPELTARSLRDGEVPGNTVLHTGDIFRTDEEGLLYFVARKDDIFKCKGEKVSPKEVEDALCELPEVAEVAVIGVEDATDGMAVKAFVVPSPGTSPSEQKLRQYCRGCLETFMVPKFIEFRDSLPKTGSGKICKKELSQSHAQRVL